MNRKVLIVDDERSIVDILRYNLEKNDMTAVCAYDGAEGLRLARECDPDVILLDAFNSLGLPTSTTVSIVFELMGAAFAAARAEKDRPSVILAKTVKGKGVSFMENEAGWHGKAPNAEQYERAVAELDAAIARLEVE